MARTSVWWRCNVDTSKSTLKLFVVRSCKDCPNSKTERTRGAGYAHDRFCLAVSPAKVVAGYIEWDSEERPEGDFPSWCPLTDALGKKSKKKGG